MNEVVRLLVLLTWCGICVSYNLESRLPLFKYGDSGSNFGFSVALHKRTTDPDGGPDDVLLLAGAPTATATSNQPSTSNPGGVFYCPVSTSTTDCRRVNMDEGGDDKKKGIKSDQWLGVSLESQGPGGLLISCAHRWRQHSGSGSNENERVCGRCFLLNTTNDNQVVEVPPEVNELNGFVSSPCTVLEESKIQYKTDYGYAQTGTSVSFGKTNYIYASPCDLLEVPVADLTSKFRYGYSQAGTSISFKSDQYTLGAPGTWQWTGALFDLNMAPQSSSELDFGELYGQTEMSETPACRESNFYKDPFYCDAIPISRDSYMGMSLAQSDKIATDSNDMYYAAGAPRANHTGIVLFFKKELNFDGESILTPVRGETVIGTGISSSFGYAIELVDVNGDGLDDLIVGAPQFYQYTNQGKYGGAVYVYLNPAERGFSMAGSQKFYGPLDSYFGHSITAIGDIDQDGFNDFAVGAPYENENGTVHIYRGSASGKVTESQVISAADFTFVPNNGEGDITGFGASLAGNVDADSNKYPDILIGSLSDHIALLRSRPVISVEMTFKARPTELDLTQTTCAFGGVGACFKVKFCFTYTAKHDEYTEEVPIKYKLILDSNRQKESKTSRVFITTVDGKKSILENKYVLPKTEEGFIIYFDPNVKDKLSSIGLDFEFDLDNQEVKRERPGQPIFPMIQDPILDADYERKAMAVVDIANNCGKDGCQSKLEVDASMPAEVTVGETEELVVTIPVRNDGEEAHQAFIAIRTPAKLELNNYTKIPESSDIACYTQQSTGQTNLILCSLGNPYANGSSDEIKIHLGINKLNAFDKELNVEVAAVTSSENPEITPITLKSKVNIQYTLSVTARGRPEQVRYKMHAIVGESAMNSSDDIGSWLEYSFTVKNEGLQPASGLYLNVDLPYEIFNGKWLLYLLSTEVTSGGGYFAGKCSNKNNIINELQLKPPLQLGSSKSRQKRQATPKTAQLAQASTQGGILQSVLKLNCDRQNAKCVPVECDLDEIQPGATISAVFLVYVWEATFIEEFFDVDLVTIQTNAAVKSKEDNVIVKGKTSDEIVTTVDHEQFLDEAQAAFPWWYILIGVLLTLIIYIIILVLLIKCGFFKRKKYPREVIHDEVIEEKPEHDDSDM